MKSSLIPVTTYGNQKGGVGKTTHTALTAIEAAAKGERVVVFDLDPQGNASSVLKMAGAVVLGSSSGLFVKTVNCELAESDNGGIYLFEADAELADLETSDSNAIDYFSKNVGSLTQGFDRAIIDTPPTLGKRMTAALAVSNQLISPIELDGFSIAGIGEMLKAVEHIRSYNPSLVFSGMVLNRVDRRSAAQMKIMSDLKDTYSDYVIAEIGIRTAIPEALSKGLGIKDIKTRAGREAAKELQAVFDVVGIKGGAL
jgi:chromosome partitioning protein